MSFLYYTLAGFLVTGMITFLASFMFGINDTSNVDKNLIAPFVHKFMEPSKYETVKRKEKLSNIISVE